MLSLDEYINTKNEEKLLKLLKNEKDLENSFNFNSIDLSNLTPEQKIIQIKLYYKISEYLIIKDKIDWDLVFRKKSIENYIDIFLQKMKPFFEKPELMEENRKILRRQFFEQIIEQLIKLNKFPTFHTLDTKNEINGLNELCSKCHTVKVNRDSCINCYHKFDDDNSENYNNNSNKENKKYNISSNNLNKVGEENNKINAINERQRTLSLRQKNINLEENNGDEKKCIRCSEINDKYSLYCSRCGGRFPIATCLDSNNINNNVYSIYNKNETESNMICNQINNNYCIYFFEKLNKNHIVSQLKDFKYYFQEEDFSSLKYLYFRTKEIIEKYYKDIITWDAYDELENYLDSIYSLFSKPSSTSFKVFNKAYEARYHKERPLTNELNFNDLTDDIKQGWLPENDVNTKYIKQSAPNKNIRIYDNIIRNSNNDEDDEIIETMMISNAPGASQKKYDEMDPDNMLTRRKRGRPKKMDIFKEKIDQDKEINTVEILPSERSQLLKSDIIQENGEILHFDFCGVCGGQGKLICCETCPTSNHPECVGYDRVPRGKYKCYFCKVAKLGISQSISVTRKHIDLVNTLFDVDDKFDIWVTTAKTLLYVLNEHPCSTFFKEPIPEEMEEYYKIVKEPRDLYLIELKLENWEYKSLYQFLDDLEYVWKDIKLYYKSNSFFWKCADVLERFVQHLIKNEKIFERFESTKHEELTKEQMEFYDKYEKEIIIKRKIEEKNRMMKRKKSHKKKEKYIQIEDSDYHTNRIKKRENEETEEEIIVTANLFGRSEEKNEESTNNIRVVKEVIESSSKLNEEDYDITLTENNNGDVSENNNKLD